MKWLLSLILIISFKINVSAQIEGEKDTIIIWDSVKKLTWNDFQGNPDITSKRIANTNYSVFFNTQNSIGFFSFNLLCQFHPMKSWAKLNDTTIKLLIHENKHFDLAEVYRRKLFKSIKEYIDTTSKFEITYIAILYKEICENELNKIQALYDAETNHSRNNAAQDKWNQKISLMLKELEMYSNIKGTYKIK